MKKIIKRIKMKSGDLYLWEVDYYGEKRYIWTKCTDNNQTEVSPSGTGYFTKTEAWNNRPRVRI